MIISLPKLMNKYMLWVNVLFIGQDDNVKYTYVWLIIQLIYPWACFWKEITYTFGYIYLTNGFIVSLHTTNKIHICSEFYSIIWAKYNRITRLLHVLTFVFFYYLHKTEEKILTLGKSIPTLLFFTFTLKISRDKMVCARFTRASKM